MNLRRLLEESLQQALVRVGLPENTPAMVMPSSRAEFGDYQANGIMPAAKTLKRNPRQLAEKVIAGAELDDVAESLQIAGPGFINVTLKKEFLADRVAEMLPDERLGVDRPAEKQTAVVDYSCPNLAKEMHVGHLRSTIIGDALVRVLEFLGHRVIRQNHVGDWGTQFGMLTAYLDGADRDAELSATGETICTFVAEIKDLEEFYRRAKKLFDEDEKFANLSREYVVKLQTGDPQVRKTWERFRNISLQHCVLVYERLGVLLIYKDVRGESFYNNDLPKVVEDLKAAGLLTESKGAQCVFLDDFKGRDNEPLPVIVQKSDGGYLYATTDLAAIRYRVRELKADRILYVTDSRQSLHFSQIFAVARKASFAPENVSLEHVSFGTMMGSDGRPFRTREGGTVKLMDLLDEAEQRALELVNEKNPDLPEEKRKQIARVVGIGAVKYADLAHNRTSDYVFSWDKMLALDGNTAPYMQYAYARIRSIFRKADVASGDRQMAAILIEEPAERALAIKLVQFPETLESVAAECLPHLLCNYLYELASAFMTFYESCPVLKSAEPIRASRLALCELTARTISRGLDLLGIETLEQM